MTQMICKEIMNGDGGCGEAFEGATPMDIAKKSSMAFMISMDGEHKPMRNMMTSSPSEE